MDVRVSVRLLAGAGIDNRTRQSGCATHSMKAMPAAGVHGVEGGNGRESVEEGRIRRRGGE